MFRAIFSLIIIASKLYYSFWYYASMSLPAGQHHTYIIPEAVIQFRCSWWWAKILLDFYVAHVGHLLAKAAQTSRTRVSCADCRLKLHRMSPRRSHSHPLSLVLSISCYCERFVLTLAIVSSFLDVDCRPERRSLSPEVLPSLTLKTLN